MSKSRKMFFVVVSLLSQLYHTLKKLKNLVLAEGRTLLGSDIWRKNKAERSRKDFFLLVSGI